MIPSRYDSNLDESKMEYKRLGVPNYSSKRISIIQFSILWILTKSDRDESIVPQEENISYQDMRKNFLP